MDYDDAPLRLFHFRVAVAASGGVFSDGYGLGIIGISLSLAAHELDLSPVWMGLLGGASLLGLFAGALLTGPAADRFGRRPIFGYNMAILAALSLLQGLTDSRPLLLSLSSGDWISARHRLRRRQGIADRVHSAPAPGTHSRVALGGLGGRLCLRILRRIRAERRRPARVALDADHERGTLPARAAAAHHRAGVAAVADESRPGRYCRRHRARHAGDGRIASRELARNACGARAAGGNCSLPAWRLRTLVACAFFTCQVIPYFAVGTFVSQVMSAMNLKSGYVGGLFYNLSLLGGAILGLTVVDRISSRSFLIGSFGVAAAAMLVLSAWSDMPVLAMSILFALFAGVLSAASNLCYVYLPELFPTDLRASGIGLAIAASRIGSAVSTFLLPVVVAGYGVRTALGACVSVLALGAVICLRWAPETRHVRLGAFDQLSSR